MVTPNPKPQLSLRTKILAVVFAFLILPPVVTVLLVNWHAESLMRKEVVAGLIESDGVFKARYKEAVGRQYKRGINRYRGIVNAELFKTIAASGHYQEEMETYLKTLINQLGLESTIMLYQPADARPPVAVWQKTLVLPEKICDALKPITAAAMQGMPSYGIVAMEAHPMLVVAVPNLETNSQAINGVLTIGIRIGQGVMNELRDKSAAEVLLVSQQKVLASTFQGAKKPKSKDLPESLLIDPAALPAQAPQEVVVEGEHFLGLSTKPEQDKSYHFVLLTSYEDRYQSIIWVGGTMLTVCVAGVILSGCLVFLLLSKLVRPLKELRTATEKIGRGDFSQRIQNFSNDECGELAEAFNHMAASLDRSNTELKKAAASLKDTQAQLVQSEKLSAVGQFVAGIAHELNNPLTVVIGFSEILGDTVKDENALAQLAYISRGAQRCHRIVHGLLSFARQHIPERKIINISTVLDDVLSFMTYDLRTSNVRIVKDYPAVLPPILADAHQFQQVFLNLLNNARQALLGFRKDPIITICAHALNGKLRVEFRDNGPGIQPEHLLKIFDPFFTTKPLGKGTGLGLSLVYGIVQEHSGVVSVQSQPGQGATFLVDLPLASPGEIEEKKPAKPPGNRTGSPLPITINSSGKTILVVDDEFLVLSLVTQFLIRMGHEVVSTHSCEQALNELAQRKFDAIVSDWRMPGMNGMQFFEFIQTTNHAAAKHFLFITGDVMSEQFQNFARQHSVPCLPKPFSNEAFKQAVYGVLETAADNV